RETAVLMFHRVLLNLRLGQSVADHTRRYGALQDPDHKHTSSQKPSRARGAFVYVAIFRGFALAHPRLRARAEITHILLQARRGAAAKGAYRRCCRSSTMSDIDFVAAPRICPPGARAKMQSY